MTAKFKHAPVNGNLTEQDRSRLAALSVTTIIMLSSLPMLLSYIPYFPGHDTIFHLFRIDGIARGLAEGQFPVMLQSTQIEGYGYPVSICYGDLFLYLPALLRLLGLSMHAAYAIFIFVANGLCATLTYVVFKRIFGKRQMGVLACALWTLSPYRLAIDTYLRSSVGEFISLCLFPAILYGIYSMVWYRSSGASKNGWIWCALGVSGVIYSHILSVLMGIITFLPVLLFELIQKRDLAILRNVLFAVIATLGLSLAFAVPFLDFYSSVEMKVNTQDAPFKQALASANALQPAQLFELFPQVAKGSVAGNTLDEMPYGIGWALLSAIPLWGAAVALTPARTRDSKRTCLLGSLMLAQIILMMWATTVYFPWSLDSNPILQNLIALLSTVQFPWRFVGPISFLLLLLLCLALTRINISPIKPTTMFIAIGVIALALAECGFGLSSFLNHSQALTEDYASHDATYGVMNGEYLPKGVDIARVIERRGGEIDPAPGINATSEADNTVTSFTMYVENRGKEGNVTIPLIQYPHYHAKTDAGAELSVTASGDGLIQVALPEGYSGAINVTFIPPIMWRVAETISLLTLIGIIFHIAFGNKRCAA